MTAPSTNRLPSVRAANLSWSSCRAAVEAVLDLPQRAQDAADQQRAEHHQQAGVRTHLRRERVGDAGRDGAPADHEGEQAQDRRDQVAGPLGQPMAGQDADPAADHDRDDVDGGAEPHEHGAQ